MSNLTYDYEKADTVTTGYLPDVDETLKTGTGICFDYAALTTAMLRSCDIPCKLQIGYAGDIKHAWIDVWILPLIPTVMTKKLFRITLEMKAITLYNSHVNGKGDFL